MARFFLPRDKIAGGVASIDGQELIHLSRVLRIRAGDRVRLFDDSGQEHEGIVRKLASDRAEVEIIQSRDAGSESGLALTLALGLTKGDKMDFVVEKATELGVSRIVPFASIYTVMRLDEERARKRTARWRKIAVSAAKQSGRVKVPEIEPPLKFRDCIESAAAAELKLFFWEQRRERTLGEIHRRHPFAATGFLALGPEGGFCEEEAELAETHGFQAVGLGPRILRAETAALTALALVQFLWGDLA